MTRATLRKKLLVGLCSTAVFGALAWFTYERLYTEAPTVEVVDTREEIQKMMERRRGRASAADPSITEEMYPPPLVRETLNKLTATPFFPALARNARIEFEPHVYLKRVGHLDFWRAFAEHPNRGWRLRTNALGMREDEEVRYENPDLRILLTGDSHMDGVLANSESCTSVMERLLGDAMPNESVEALNVACGSYSLYNYLGTFERFTYLQPDVFIVVVYGGNDFSGAMVLQRYFKRRGALRRGPHHLAIDTFPSELRSLVAQELNQERYFLNHPRDEQFAVDLACTISVELDRLSQAACSKLLFVYLPPPTRGQPEMFRDELRELLSVSGIPESLLGVSDRIADRWLKFLDDRSIEYIDLREPIRTAEDCLYWRTDHHLNVLGHQLVGEILAERVELMLASD